MSVTHLTWCLTLLAATLLLPGCGGQAEAKFDDYLEELEFDGSLESVAEVEVGSYRFSCAARHKDQTGREIQPVWVEVSFQLFVGASIQDESAILDACERHRGMLDDAIITVFRRASIDELKDNNWAAMKSKVIDTIRPLLGENRVRQIFFKESGWEPI